MAPSCLSVRALGQVGPASPMPSPALGAQAPGRGINLPELQHKKLLRWSGHVWANFWNVKQGSEHLDCCCVGSSTFDTFGENVLYASRHGRLGDWNHLELLNGLLCVASQVALEMRIVFSSPHLAKRTSNLPQLGLPRCRLGIHGFLSKGKKENHPRRLNLGVSPSHVAARERRKAAPWQSVLSPRPRRWGATGTCNVWTRPGASWSPTTGSLPSRRMGVERDGETCLLCAFPGAKSASGLSLFFFTGRGMPEASETR